MILLIFDAWQNNIPTEYSSVYTIIFRERIWIDI